MKFKSKLIMLIGVNATIIFFFKSYSSDIVNHAVVVLNPVYILGMFGIILQMAILFSGVCYMQDNSLSIYTFYRGSSLYRVFMRKYMNNVIRLNIVFLCISLAYSIFFTNNYNFQVIDIVYKVVAISISFYYYMLLELMFNETKGFMVFNILSLIMLVINLLSVSIFGLSLAFLWPTNMWYSNLSNNISGFVTVCLLLFVLLVTPYVIKQKNFN